MFMVYVSLGLGSASLDAHGLCYKKSIDSVCRDISLGVVSFVSVEVFCQSRERCAVCVNTRFSSVSEGPWSVPVEVYGQSLVGFMLCLSPVPVESYSRCPGKSVCASRRSWSAPV